MPNLGPLITSRADNNPLYSLAVENVTGFPYGISYNNGWTPLTGTNTLSTIISVPGLQLNTPLSCTLQSKGRSTQNIVDCVNCWLVSAYASPNQIFIQINNGGGGTDGAPVDNANFGISWAIAGDPV